jgi:peptide/nickel transport system substrate-binding protein
VSALTVVDPTTLNITLASPQPSFPRTVSRNLSWIPSPTALAKHGTNYGTSPETVVGAGPYVLKQWLKDSQLAYDRNPNYYDAPKPYIDHIVYLVNGDATALLNSFKGGQAQGVIYGRADAAAEAKAAGATVAQIPATGVPEVQLMNVTIPPFNDIRVRQGFNMALDPKLLTTLLYDTGTIPKQHYLIPESSPWFNKKAAFPTFDAKKAQALFNDVAKETGKPIAIKHLEVTGDRMGEAHQTMMSTYQNVSVAPDKLTVTDYVTTIQQKKFEYARWTCPSASTSNIQADPDPALYDCFHSKSRINISGYSNPRVDTLLEQGRAATSFKDRKAAYDEVQEILAQDLPMLVQQVVIPGASFLLAKNLKGFELRLWGPDFSTMWLAKA